MGLGYRFLDGKENYATGTSWLEKAVEGLKIASAQGCIAANYLLGECYRYYQGVPYSNCEAMKWYAKAMEGYAPLAEGGDAEAQYILGCCYYWEKGVKPDKNKAFAFFEKAALQGHVLAEYRFACCYIFGQGTEVDDEKIIYWLEKAVAHGIVDAMDYLGFYCFYERAGEGRGYAEAVSWFEKAIECGSSKSDTLELLGMCYGWGLGTERNVPKAVELLEIVASREIHSARERLEELSDEGFKEADDALDRLGDEYL